MMSIAFLFVVEEDGEEDELSVNILLYEDVSRAKARSRDYETDFHFTHTHTILSLFLSSFVIVFSSRDDL